MIYSYVYQTIANIIVFAQGCSRNRIKKKQNLTISMNAGHFALCKSRWDILYTFCISIENTVQYSRVKHSDIYNTEISYKCSIFSLQ